MSVLLIKTSPVNPIQWMHRPKPKWKLPMDNQELVNQLKTVFDLCDPQGLGYITVASFFNLGQHYLRPHQEDVEQLLYLLDPGAKGYMTFDDFCRGIFAAMQGYQLEQMRNHLSYLHHDDIGTRGVPVVGDDGRGSLICTCSVCDDLTNEDDPHCALHHRQSPVESFGDADSAIVVVPPTSESGSGSPDFSRKIISVSDGEEKFECYGEGDGDCEDYDINPSASSTPTASSKNNHTRHGKAAQSFQKRTTWLRTSLRRSPSERRRMSSNALASQLYRSSSFNSSSRNSSSGESDDMHQDLSLEDDVLDLNQKVHVLQQQVSALAHNQTSSDDKYGRVKQENAALTAKIQMLEEQIRELEVRSDDRLKEEQQRFKELMTRHERDRSIEIETYTVKLHTLEKDSVELREEIFRLRAVVERLKQEKSMVQDQLAETEYALASLHDEHRKLQELGKRERDGLAQERVANVRIVEELSKELQDLRRFKVDTEIQYRGNGHVGMEPPSRLRDLEEQIRLLKEENRSLREANEELQAQLLNTSIAEGRNLLHNGEGTSLAAEFEAMSKDEVMEALREQREVNAKLRAYIDGILLNIMECYPSILEVKVKERPRK